MSSDLEVKRIVERLKQRFPSRSEEDLTLCARIAHRAFENTPCYTTAEIIKMAGKQRARSAATAERHELVAIEMAVLVKLLKMGRKAAALVLSYAHWNEYSPSAIFDFYNRHLPKEYRKNTPCLYTWLENNHNGLQNYRHTLISRIERFGQLLNKAPKAELNKLFADLPPLATEVP